MIITKKSLQNDIEGTRSIKEFIISSEEIAANNMRKIRNAVITRRDFLTELRELYNEVKRSYKNEVSNILKKNKNSKDSKYQFLKKNNKTACVFLSTNTSLYGDIVLNTFNLFQKQIKLENNDPVVVGKLGKRLFEEVNPGVIFDYFDFPDEKIELKLLKPIVLLIIQYEKVIIFHSKFETLVRQTPTAFVISESEMSGESQQKVTNYIFEPSLEKIVEYFEKEIFSSIFEQTMHESHLSKFAARMVALDQATDNIKKNLSQLYMKQRVLDHQTINKQQLNSIGSLVAWRRGR